MQDVELMGTSRDMFQHDHVQGVGVSHRAFETQGSRPHCLEFR